MFFFALHLFPYITAAGICALVTQKTREATRGFSSQGALNWLLSDAFHLCLVHIYIFIEARVALEGVRAASRVSSRRAAPGAAAAAPRGARARAALNSSKTPLSALRARSTGNSSSTRARANPPHHHRIYNAIGFCQQKNANVFSLVTFSNIYSC
jgi:hypothetical protein